MTYNGTDTSEKTKINKNKQRTPEQNKWACHLIAPNYHFDKWKNIKAGKQMTPRAPPAPLLPEEETGKYSCYHTSSETQRWEKEGGSGGLV